MSKRYTVQFSDGTTPTIETWATREEAQKFCDESIRWKGQLRVVETDSEVPCSVEFGADREGWGGQEMSERCEICGEPMPEGEQMFKFHGYSGECPKPPLPKLSIGDWATMFVARVLTFARTQPITSDASHFTKELIEKLKR